MKTFFCCALVAACACDLTGCANALYKKAIKANTEAIERNPNDAEAYEKRGTAKKFEQDFTGAMADLRKSIELNPKNGMAYTKCADIKLGWKDFTGAITDADNAVKLNQNDSLGLAYLNRGLAKFHLNDLDAAIGDYDNAIKAAPLLTADQSLCIVSAYRLRAQAKKKKGDVQGARVDTDLAQTAALNAATMPSSDPGGALMPGVHIGGPGVQPAFNAAPGPIHYVGSGGIPAMQAPLMNGLGRH